SPMTFGGTNTWILSEPGAPACVVVDPGPEEQTHLEAILAACEEDNLTIAAVVLTHGHLDHSEGAAHLARLASAPLCSREADTLPNGSFSVADDGPQLEVISIPGHSSDSVAFCFSADCSIVSGDIVFLHSTTVICWPDGGLAEYLDSLKSLRRKVVAGGYKKLLTAHGAPIEDPIGIIDRTEAHRIKRLSHVRDAIERSDSIDLDDILEEVYTDIDMRLSPAARLSIQAQLHYLIDIHDPSVRARQL
ncbi:MAG: MBL fold metallo-hydrolase, partial [Raoultibacter sp.]